MNVCDCKDKINKKSGNCHQTFKYFITLRSTNVGRVAGMVPVNLFKAYGIVLAFNTSVPVVCKHISVMQGLLMNAVRDRIRGIPKCSNFLLNNQHVAIFSIYC
jgi:hypothetical protein